MSESKPITQSILLTIKKMLGISEEYHAFDIDVITDINAVFLTLNQLGVGPILPYAITGDEETWQDFLGEQYDYLAGVQTYVYQRVRLLFDPPTNAFLVDAMRKSCDEFEWRFAGQPKNQAQVEKVESFKDLDKNQNESVDESTESELTPGQAQAYAVEALWSKVPKDSIIKNPPSLYDIFA